MTNTIKAKIHYEAVQLVVDAKMPKTSIAASLNLILSPTTANRNRPMESVYVPKFEVGSLVVLVSAGVCSHLGIISGAFDEADSPDCIVDLWPTKEPVPVHNRPRDAGSMHGRLMKHLFEAVATDLNFIGCLSKLPRLNADYLRAQIGPYAPQNILEIFWTEDEIQQLNANQAAQDRYEKLATTLIESLET